MKEIIRRICYKIMWYKYNVADKFKDRREYPQWQILEILWLQSNKCYHVAERRLL